MKNIHLLPTDKPSRLVKFFTNKLHLCKEILPIQDEEQYQNIYITSDEEIKEGVDQWYLDKVLNEPYNSGGAQYSSKQDVIILTTDPDLIKDGVQAIDEEFLEWFVNNPSCEEVEVKREKIRVDENFNDISHWNRFVHKIIIPKEETKQETVEEEFKFKNRQMGAAGFVGNKIMENMISKFKQETLEEVAHEMLVDYGIKSIGQSIGVLTVKKLMVNMAKWQSERMYSEEEVRKMLFDLGDVLFNNCQNGIKEGEPEEYFDVIIEQFKKK